MPRSFKVVVIGSLNIDYIAEVARLPRRGETISAAGLIQRFGGKGANQAVAAARQGASVSMLGCVGEDHHGSAYVNRLRREGINVTGISTTKKALTGTALIAVENTGENLIIVAPGANGEFGSAAVRRHLELVSAAQILLLQFEVPFPAIFEAIRQAAAARVPVVLNPSPWKGGFPWGRWRIDTVVTNELEAQALFGLDRKKLALTAAASIRRRIAQKQIEWLIVTRGARPTLCIGRDQAFEVPTLPVTPVDTVGAGDAFAGCYASARAEAMGVHEAVKLANAAGALATLRRGAQESIPNRSTTRRMLRKF